MPNEGTHDNTYQALQSDQVRDGYHHYDIVQRVQTDEGLNLYQVANKAGGGDHVYTSPEEINHRNGIQGTRENED